MKIYFLTFCLIYQLTTLFGQEIMLSRDQVLEDFDWLTFSLDHVHPRLYKFESKAIVQDRFGSVRNSLLDKDSISSLDFLSLISRLNATVNCGHLYTIPQDDLREVVLGKMVLPFQIKILDDKMFVFHDVGKGKKIPNGSEVISINGKFSNEILELMKAGIATDGFIETRKNRLIERYFFETFHGFDLYYHLHVDRSKDFNIKYRKYNADRESATTKSGIPIVTRNDLLNEVHEVDVMEWFSRPSPLISYNEESNYAVLTISRSFHNKEIDPNYKAELSKFFKRLEEMDIKNLIIDLRENEGGSEEHEAELIRYLYDKPHKLYDKQFYSRLDFRELIPVINLQEYDTANLWYHNNDQAYRKVNDKLWVNNKPTFEGLEFINPANNTFKGHIYVLMSGISFSSTSSLIANIKNTTNAVFIGEESGGMYEGPTGGMEIPIILPNSRIMVRMSPNIHWTYLYKSHPIGRGVLPDYQISYTIDDLVKRRDLEMQKAMELINAKD